jgi:hypothetical protein
VTASGNITQTGVITATGINALLSTTGDIILNDTANDFGFDQCASGRNIALTVPIIAYVRRAFCAEPAGYSRDPCASRNFGNSVIKVRCQLYWRQMATSLLQTAGT